MRAGSMRYRLELLRPERRIDEFGSEKVVYSVVGTAHAERVRASGARSDEVGEHFPSYSVRWYIRDAHKVEENWRVRQITPSYLSYTYTVTNVVPMLDLGMLMLITERLNE